MVGCHLCGGERAVIHPVVWAYAFSLWPAGAVSNVFHVALIPLTLAFGCLGWASRGDSGPLQRWASRGLLVVTMFGVFSVIRILFGLFGLPTGQRWLWLASLAVALRAATWAAVGAWLRSRTLVLQSSDGLSNPNLGTQD